MIAPNRMSMTDTMGKKLWCVCTMGYRISNKNEPINTYNMDKSYSVDQKKTKACIHTYIWLHL